MVLREQDKHFLSILYSAVAIIFVWKGVWEGIYVLAETIFVPLSDPFVFLFIGSSMLIISGFIFNELLTLDPLGGIQKAINRTLRQVYTSPQKEKFEVKYYDKNKKQLVTIPAGWIHRMEKEALVIAPPRQKQEMFVPVSRVKEILYQGKIYWRL